jgi:hypothetical protein
MHKRIYANPSAMPRSVAKVNTIPMQGVAVTSATAKLIICFQGLSQMLDFPTVPSEISTPFILGLQPPLPYALDILLKE